MKSFYRYARLSFLVIIVLMSVYTIYFLNTAAVRDANGFIYDLKPGTSKQKMIEDLTNAKVISSPKLYALYIYAHGRIHLKAGEYFFAKGATPIKLWRQMSRGHGLLQHAFTIIPGWNFKQLKSALNNAESLQHILLTSTDEEIMHAIGEDNIKPEGLFFPDTYYYVKGNTDVSILKRAFFLMQKKLQDAYAAKQLNLPFKSAYEALIAASLVEKEAYLANERPIIAGVLINRIKQNMLLQFDPTVIYGLGDRYDGKIYFSNLREDNPYNTYTRKGLPPTPIAMPSLSSLRAVTQPANHEYLYFVAKGDGSHQFSVNLNQHHLAVSAAALRHSAIFFNDDLVKHYLQKSLQQ